MPGSSSLASSVPVAASGAVDAADGSAAVESPSGAFSSGCDASLSMISSQTLLIVADETTMTGVGGYILGEEGQRFRQLTQLPWSKTTC